MTQNPQSQTIAELAMEVEIAWEQLEIAQTILEVQRNRLREISAELRNAAQSLMPEAD